MYRLTRSATGSLKRPDQPRRYRLPFGLLIPLLATCSAIALLVSARPRAAEFRFSGVLLLIGFGAWLATWLGRRSLAPRS